MFLISLCISSVCSCCLVASSSLFPPCLKSSSVSHDFQSSSDNDPCLYNRLRVCLLLAGTSASTNNYLCDDDPGLDIRIRRPPLPVPDWNCLFVFGLSYRVPNRFSKACYSPSLSPSRAFESSVSTYITVRTGQKDGFSRLRCRARCLACAG